MRNEKFCASGRRDDLGKPIINPDFNQNVFPKNLKDLYAKRKKKLEHVKPLP